MTTNKNQQEYLCKCCNVNIVESMALTKEGRDYLYYFCGEECLDRWQKKQTNKDKSNE